MQSPLLFLGDIGGGEIMLLLLLVFPLVGLLHFLPSIIGRKRPDILLIFLVNLLAGWSVIGWLVALYLALRKTSTHTPLSFSPAPAGYAATSVADEIAKLRDLRDQGVLTQQEFERQKNNLLS
jgi:hypothetical protein